MTQLALIVDDDKASSELFAYKLADSGYATATVATAQDAIAYLQAHDPNLILLDLKLPMGHGTDVLDHLIETDRLDGCRVVIVSAGETTMPLKKYANRFPVVAKPVRMRDFQRLIQP